MSQLRASGNLVRFDVLYSCLQKGIRRCDPRLALWAAALLIKAGQWTKLSQRLCQHQSEDITGFVEPHNWHILHGRVKKIQPRLMKRGVSKDTLGSRKIIFEWVTDLVYARKNRAAADAKVASLNAALQGGPAPKAPGRALVRCLEAAEDEREAIEYLGWLTSTSADGGDRASIWKALKRYDRGDQMQNLWELSHVMVVGQKGRLAVMPTLALYQAVLLRFREVESVTHANPSQRHRAQITRQENMQFWNRVLDQHDQPKVRNMVDWESHFGTVMDTSTAVGMGQGTIDDLLSTDPEFPKEYFLPDHCGVERASRILHLYKSAYVCENQSSTNAYSEMAKTLMWNVERGRASTVLGQGIEAATYSACVEAIRSKFIGHNVKLRSKSLGRNRSARQNVDACSPRKPPSRGRLRTNSSSSSTRLRSSSRASRGRFGNSKPPPPPMPLIRTVPDRKNAHAPCGLIGIRGEHDDDETRSGPEMLEGQCVSENQMSEAPRQSWLPTSWISILDNRKSLWIHACSELASTVPVYLDKIKPLFNLPCLDIRWSGNWLIVKDLGSGGPYPTVERGSRKFEVIDRSKTSIVYLNDFDSKTPLPSETLSGLTLALVFRKLYGVLTRGLHDFLFVDGRIFSTREETASDGGDTRGEPEREGIGFFFDEPPAHEIHRHQLTEYWSSPTGRKLIDKTLHTWTFAIQSCPPIHRPISDFPKEGTILTRLRECQFLLSCNKEKAM